MRPVLVAQIIAGAALLWCVVTLMTYQPHPPHQMEEAPGLRTGNMYLAQQASFQQPQQGAPQMGMPPSLVGRPAPAPAACPVCPSCDCSAQVAAARSEAAAAAVAPVPAPQCPPCSEARTRGGVYAKMEDIARKPNPPWVKQQMDSMKRSGVGLANVYQDLRDYTDLTTAEIDDRLLRKGPYNFKAQYAWLDPKSVASQTLFYRFSEGYLWGNAVHVYNKELWKGATFLPQNGPILEFAAGIGNNIVPLAEAGFDAHYLDVSLVQQDFARFRLEKRGLLDKVRFIDPWKAGVYDSIAAIPSDIQYQAILAVDVLEHIPHYEKVVAKFLQVLKPGGYMVVQAPFDGGNKELGVHLKASMPMKQAMGPTMTQLGPCLWQKAR